MIIIIHDIWIKNSTLGQLHLNIALQISVVTTLTLKIQFCV